MDQVGWDVGDTVIWEELPRGVLIERQMMVTENKEINKMLTNKTY